MPFEYDYPRPMVTVDIIMLRYKDKRLEILLIQRKNFPFRGEWAFPGGFVEMDETINTAATRELSEETSLTIISPFPLFIADQPHRDPRGRTISHILCGILSPPGSTPKAGDDAAGVKWFPLNHPPPLAFDHAELIEKTKTELQFHFLFRFRLLAFFEKNFATADIQNVLNELGTHKKYANCLLHHAFELGLVKKTVKGHYIKTVTADELIKLDNIRMLRTFYETKK